MDITAIGSSQFLDSSQWRLTFPGLGREAKLFISSEAFSEPIPISAIDGKLDWISLESTSPPELIFDLNRISPQAAFSLEAKVEANVALIWTLEALNSDTTWSAGSLELTEGDKGQLIEFEPEDEAWYFTAFAPTGSKRAPSTSVFENKPEMRKTRVLIDASPSARAKLDVPAVHQLIDALDRIMNRDGGERLSVSYLGQFEQQFSREQQIASQHKNALNSIANSEQRPEPLRKVVFRQIDNAPRGSRLVVISDGSFLVSGDLSLLAQERDVTVQLLVLGNPAVVPEFSDSPMFKMTLIRDSLSDQELEEICLSGN